MFKTISNDGPRGSWKRKSMNKNTQWVRERRKYPNEETFAVRKLVLVYHSLGTIG